MKFIWSIAIVFILVGSSIVFPAGAQTAPVGKASVYLFLQAKCPCIYEHKDTFRKIIRTYGDKANIKAVFVGPQDSPESAQDLLRQLNWDVEYLVDKTHRYVRMYNPSVSTDVVVANGSGNVYYKGAIDDGFKNMGMVKNFFLDRVLKAYIEGNPVPFSGTSGGGCTIMPIKK